MKKIAIIPARGGSKRILRKNIRHFCGKPIIAYSIETAIQSKLFNEVMVSTDDDEIEKVSKRYGANVPFMRSKKNSNDFATTTDVLLEVLKRYKTLDKKFDYLCCIYPTAPFITTEKLRDSFNLMIERNSDSIIPVVKFNYPIQRAFKINNGNQLEYFYQENINKRSQDLEPAYHDAGQFYWMKMEEFLHNRALITTNTVGVEVSEMEVQDIDSQNDWEIAEIKYKLLKKVII